jgi:hypothetical protein
MYRPHRIEEGQNMVDERRRGLVRRAAPWLGGGVAVVLVLYLAVLVIARAVLDPASLADRAEPYLSSALNRRVSVAAAELSVFPRPEVRLLRVRVENLPDFEGLPLATIDEFRLRPRLLPLIQKRIEIESLGLVGPRVLFQVDDGGMTNFGDFVPASRDDGAAASPVALQVRGIDVRDGRIGYRDAMTGRSVQVDGLRAEGEVARMEDGRLELDIGAGAEGVRFALPPAWSRGIRDLRVQTNLRAVAGPGMEWLEIGNGTITVNGLTLAVQGRVDSLRSPRRHVDLRLAGDGVDLAQVLEALPDSLRGTVPVEAWGTLGVDVVARGRIGPGEYPVVEGMVTVRGAGLRRGRARSLLQDADADVRLSEGTARATGMRARLPGGEVSASGELVLDSTLSFRVELDANAEAGGLLEATGGATGQGPRARSGILVFEGRARGVLSRPAATRVDGELRMRDLEVMDGRLVTPLVIPTAVVRLEGAEARWEDVAVRAGDDELRVSGTVTDLFAGLSPDGVGATAGPVVQATARAVRLDLDALLGPVRDQVGYGRIAWSRLAERPLAGRAPEDWALERELRRPGTLPVGGSLSFRIDSLTRRPYRFDAVEGRFDLAPERIDISGVSFGVYGGHGTASGELLLGDNFAEPFRLNLSLVGVRAEQYLADNSPLGDLVSGTLTLDLDLEGGLDSLSLPVTRLLQGTGRFEILDGRLASNPLTDGVLSFLSLGAVRDLEFSRWTSPIMIRDGTLLLDGADFFGSTLVAELRGALGFGGSLDLGALVRPDSALARGAAAAAGVAGEAVDRFLDAGGALELAVRLTGQASDPRVELDPDAMGQSTRSVLEHAAQEAARSGQEDLRERGLNLLRGLAGGGAEPAPADSSPAAVSDTTPRR